QIQYEYALDGGAGGGYLRITNQSPGNFGVRSAGPEYAGDWVAAGITQVRLWLNDVGADDSLEIHVALGNAYGYNNFWQYNVGFAPPHDRWAEFVVDLTNAANWTQIEGSGTFADALRIVDRILIRHDRAPFAHPPDPIAADLGIDHLLLTDGVSGPT